MTQIPSLLIINQMTFQLNNISKCCIIIDSDADPDFDPSGEKETPECHQQ